MGSKTKLSNAGPIVFLVPGIHVLQTGGNVFNRRVVAGLRPETTVRVETWDPDARPSSALDVADASLLVADSLLARHPESLRDLRKKHAAVPLVLLVHYLHCVDPYAADTETAANERATLGVVDAVIATSRFVRRSIVDEGLAAERVQVVRPGLDERYRVPLPTRLGRGASRMLTVANLLPEKGLLSFLDMLVSLRDLPWTWTLVGDASLDPAYAERFFRRLQAVGLADRVTWTGPIAPEVLRTWYDRADLFVLPSHFESCSLSTREAMARGLPVVGRRVGGMPENFGDAPAGHLVFPNDSPAFRAALRSLLTDPMARTQKGVAAWRRSRDFPTWDEAAARFREALTPLQTEPTGPNP